MFTRSAAFTLNPSILGSTFCIFFFRLFLLLASWGSSRTGPATKGPNWWGALLGLPGNVPGGGGGMPQTVPYKESNECLHLWTRLRTFKGVDNDTDVNINIEIFIEIIRQNWQFYTHWHQHSITHSLVLFALWVEHKATLTLTLASNYQDYRIGFNFGSAICSFLCVKCFWPRSNRSCHIHDLRS